MTAGHGVRERGKKEEKKAGEMEKATPTGSRQRRCRRGEKQKKKKRACSEMVSKTDVTPGFPDHNQPSGADGMRP